MDNKRKFISQCATGQVEMTLSQADMARAVEFWLNSKVLRTPCWVKEMKESRVNSNSTFTVMLVEAIAGDDVMIGLRMTDDDLR